MSRSCLLFPKLINPQLVEAHLAKVESCLLFPKLINPQQEPEEHIGETVVSYSLN